MGCNGQVDYTRTDPDAGRLERVILAAAMLNCIDLDTLGRLRPDHFEEVRHRVILRAVCDVQADGGTSNLVTVVDRLQSSKRLENAGGATYVQSLCDEAPNVGGLDYVVTRLEDRRVKRAIVEACMMGVELARNGDRASDILKAVFEGLDRVNIADVVSEMVEFDLVAFSEGRIPPIEWIVPGWIARGSLIMFAAYPGVGKSTVASVLVQAIAEGESWCGIRPCVNGPALVFDDEQDGTLCGRLYMRTGGPHENLHLYVQPELRLQESQSQARFERAIALHSPRLVVIDSATATFGSGDMNADPDVAAYLNPLKHLCRKHRCAILVLHHPRKPAKQGSRLASLHDIRGSGLWTSVPDAVWVANRTHDRPMQLEQVKTRGAPKRSLLVEYQEEGETGAINLTGVERHSTRQSNSVFDKAVEVIESFLAERTKARTSEILDACIEAGCSRATSQRALRSMVKDLIVISLSRGEYALSSERSPQGVMQDGQCETRRH